MDEKILGRYELTGRLGRGGMGEVWAAHDHSLDRQIALKFLAPTGQHSTPTLLEERFRREARYTARLQHSGVPEIHDVGKLPDGRLYLVMELVEGRTLTALLREHGSCPVDQALSIAGQIAAVLVRAHRSGLVHRDLKPSNLMLTPSGRVKVLDFGIAAALTPSPAEPRLTHTGGVPGTPGFISPEQALGKPATDRSDIYALGCVLYEILTGRPPFTAATPLVVAYLHVHEQPAPVVELRPETPTELAALVMRMLAKEPAERPSAEEVVAAVRDLRRAAGAATSAAAVILPRQPVRAANEVPTRATAAERNPHARETERRNLERDSPYHVAEDLERCRSYYEAEDYVRAYAGYRDLAEELAEDPHAPEHLAVFYQKAIGACLLKLGQANQARTLYSSLASRLVELYGPVDDGVLSVRLNLVSALGQCGRYSEAVEAAVLLRADLQSRRPDDPKITDLDGLIARLARLQLAAQRTHQPPA
ncbi:serine/threonine-protein kinase [Streptomyces sp. ISL-100]|uniref:serine/threonine-protein kinase n=1 Tax=Streptomyces sp. ISL-100 TaxID=2819173 RepID=UPI001BE8EBE3|nr:serine/threonine-protein kinase [Streptomyces sp. ISL-100]MBT2400392.1 serine/threonine protein kinase [Streptomyces sp. ISL-100]